MSESGAYHFLLDENVERQVGAYLAADGHTVDHVVDILEPGR